MDILSVLRGADLAAFGAYPGMLAAGLALLRLALGRSERLPWGLAAACALALGNAAFFAAAYALARAGAYDGRSVGALGWGAFGLAAAFWGRRLWSARPKALAGKRPWLAAAAFAGLFVFYAAFPDESILGMRDQGVYFMRGMAIERTGGLDLALPHPRLDDPGFGKLRENLNPNGLYFDGDGRATLQFSPYLPINYAQGYATFGYGGIQWLNPFLGAGSALLFAWLCRRFLGWGWTLLAGLLFAFSQPQIWNVRITLSEPLAQAHLLCGLALAAHAAERRLWRGLALAGGLAMASSWARIDALLFGPLLVAGFALWRLWSGPEVGRTGRDWGFPAATFLVGVFGVWMYWDSTRPYFLQFREELLGFAGCFALSCLAVWAAASPRTRPILARLLAASRLRWALAVGLALLALYAYVARPELEPFHLSTAGHEVGQRSYREETLRFYAHYLSLPALVFGVAGACLALRRTLAGGERALCFLLAAWLGFALLYSYDPRISNDHIWRMRRFTPIVLPGLAFFAAYAAQAGGRRWIASGRARAAALTVLCLGASVHHGVRSASMYPIVQYEGSIGVLERVAETVPEEALVIADINPYFAGPLYVAHGLSLIRAELDDPAQLERARELAAEAADEGRPIWWIGAFPAFDAAGLRPAGRFAWRRPILETPKRPPVERYWQRWSAFEVVRVGEAILPSLAWAGSLDVGPHPAYGVEARGLHGVERMRQGRPFRWTDGAARFELEPHPLNPVTSLELEISGAPPGGAWAELLVGGETVWREGTARRGTAAIVEAPKRLRKSPFVVELLSGSWVPAEAGSSADTRRLGLRLGKLALRFAQADAVGPGWYVPELDPRLEAKGWHDLERGEEGPFRWTDGAGRLAGRFNPAFEPERIELDFRVAEAGETAARLKWNGRTLVEGLYPPGRHRVAAPLPGGLAGASWELTLESETFVPSASGMGADDRRLGVRVYELAIW